MGTRQVQVILVCGLYMLIYGNYSPVLPGPLSGGIADALTGPALDYF